MLVFKQAKSFSDLNGVKSSFFVNPETLTPGLGSARLNLANCKLDSKLNYPNFITDISDVDFVYHFNSTWSMVTEIWSEMKKGYSEHGQNLFNPGYNNGRNHILVRK